MLERKHTDIILWLIKIGSMIWLVNCWTVSRWVFVIRAFWVVPVNALIRTYFILWKIFPCEQNNIKLDSILDIYIKGFSSRVSVYVDFFRSIHRDLEHHWHIWFQRTRCLSSNYLYCLFCWHVAFIVWKEKESVTQS